MTYPSSDFITRQFTTTLSLVYIFYYLLERDNTAHKHEYRFEREQERTLYSCSAPAKFRWFRGRMQFELACFAPLHYDIWSCRRKHIGWIGKFRRIGSSSGVVEILYPMITMTNVQSTPLCRLCQRFVRGELVDNRTYPDMSRVGTIHRLIKKEWRRAVVPRWIIPLRNDSFIKLDPYRIHRHFRPGSQVKLDRRILEFN